MECAVLVYTTWPSIVEAEALWVTLGVTDRQETREIA